jgi:hypothetical protein
MTDYHCTEEQFLKDAARHVMTVIRDDGVHRHIRFKRPDSGTYWFDLITWPGSLCIDGDCGTYVFRRLEDMFQFFRQDREENTLYINPQYWGEKLQAVASQGGYKEFCKDSFKANVKRWFDDWVESEEPSEDLKFALWAEIENDVLDRCEDGEHEAYSAAYNFSSDVSKDFDFTDFFEVSSQVCTFHFIWCCYAIAWGVKTYDEATASTKEAA